MTIEQVQCCEVDCRKLMIKNGPKHTRCSDCSSKRQRKMNIERRRKARQAEPIKKQCGDCGKMFITKNKKRIICGDCRHAGNTYPRKHLGMVHLGNGPKHPAEKVWEQMLRECR